MACANPFDPIEGLRKQRARDELEAKITELWGHLNAATYRFLSWSPSSIARKPRAARAHQHGAMVELAMRHRARCGAREGSCRAGARAIARDQGRVRERRDLVLEGSCDDTRRDAGERIGARARRTLWHGRARRETRT